jgi:ribosomal protein S18 acetylase RimI-like enzyme
MTFDLLDPARRRVAFIEAAAADALAPLEERRLDGWRMRADDGGTRRGNSALPEARGREPLARKLAAAEAFYRRRGRAARVQLSAAAEPAGLDAALDAAGWIREEGAYVMVRSLRGGQGPTVAPGEVRVGPDDLEWIEVQASVAPGRAVGAVRRAAGLHAAGRTAWQLRIRDEDGRPVAAGLAVLDPVRRTVGLFQFATRPEARRRGWARRLLEATLAHASEAGAEDAYLQVHGANEGARRLYAGLGFADHHRYHYRRAPDVAGSADG